MRVIVEVAGRAFVFQFLQGKVTTDDSDEQEFEHAPVDPHSVGGGQVERGPGADAFVSDVVAGRKFGFSHGS
jgi:hypothetical protein